MSDKIGEIIKLAIFKTCSPTKPGEVIPLDPIISQAKKEIWEEIEKLKYRIPGEFVVNLRDLKQLFNGEEK